jgi:hypothetical protein
VVRRLCAEVSCSAALDNGLFDRRVRPPISYIMFHGNTSLLSLIYDGLSSHVLRLVCCDSCSIIFVDVYYPWLQCT